MDSAPRGSNTCTLCADARGDRHHNNKPNGSVLMFAAPGTLPDLTHKFTREAAERVASNWW
jgi:hypothetical protein